MDGFECTETLCDGGSALAQLSGLGSTNNGAIASDGGVMQNPWADDILFDFSLSPIDVQWDLTTDSTASGTATSLGGSAAESVVFSATSPDQGSLNLYIPSLMPNLTSADDKALFNHYSAVVANTLCRTSQSNVSNPYILHILPMAVSDDTIRHCVLALSGSHWKRTQPRLSERGLVHQAKATQALAGMLSTTSQQTTDVALAACLLLCLNEILDGQSSGWKHHLEGAKRLMAARATADVTDLASEYAFLVDLARFLDSATTTSTCAPPVMQKNDTNAAFLSRLSSRLSNHDTAVYGVPKALFHLVDKINNLAQKRKTRIDAQSEDSFLQETALTEDLLDHWSFEYGGLSQAVANLTSLSRPDHDTLQATIAYEWALRLRLHQIRDGYKLSHDFVPRCVDRILGAVQEIRYGSPLEGCLLFPLVMAGGACGGLEQRIIIQDRLMVMERTYGFGYVYCARDLVEKVWEQRDALEGTGAIVNWARMRFEEMSGLVIF
ncbi:uncharacterized protein J7T54_008475 [Emericellopsis cladophorae]|uniref:Uncharacterized protein n=1 Tax=Emericellopsis cladophorae TaxID=2686198 RepID=A0A9Q0BAF7_9HYPO|nr:uncharacterized protein J7T54_008475 [Emericellopsis cladophorae]KAI6778297.1 hypothetical protein J7T54_008475 [Emericellopsis cladophorae]